MRSLPVCGLVDTVVALSTLKGGVVFLNPTSGKIDQIINYQSGLPDNEVYAMALDREKSIWIAHKDGFTLVSPGLFFRNFSSYPGLKGDLLSVINYNDTLYVGTSLGLYCLETIREYDLETYLEPDDTSGKNIHDSKAAGFEEYSGQSDSSQPAGALTRLSERDDSRRGIFGFLRKKGKGKRSQRGEKNRDNDKRESAGVTNAQRDGKATPPVRSSVTYTKQVEKKLRSIRYVYKKIDAIDSKVFQLMISNGKLFCSGLDGLFEIKGKTVVPVTKTPVRSFYISKHHKHIFANTYDDLIKVYHMDEGYPEKYMFGDFKSNVQHIFEDQEYRVWFCSTDRLFWVAINAADIIETDEYAIDNPYFYKTYGTATEKGIVYINESGVYELDMSKNQTKRVAEGTSFESYLVGANNKVWAYKDQHWSMIGADLHTDKFNPLNLLHRVNYIAPNKEGVYWIITTDNKLFRFSSQSGNALASFKYDLFLRTIKTDAENFRSSGSMKVNQDKSSVGFEFIQPDYSGIMDIEYQYCLEGMNGCKWSGWSEKYANINFPYLPEGNYTLKVRSRNAFGTVSDISTISFKVVPPYWKRPWFYAIEFCGFILLLFISVRVKNLGYRYRLGSRLLALLVLIIILEFIQTIGENKFQTQSSPIFDFVIQVTMAIIILPVEGLLRKYIFKEKNVQLMDFMRIRNKTSKNEN